MLDKNLMPEDAPVTSKRPITGYEFDTMSDRGMVKRFTLGGAEITTDNIANLAVTTPKLDNLSVTTGKIANGAVTDIKIASFDWAKGTGGTISTGTVLGVPYKTGTITTSLITGGTQTNPDISGGTTSGALFSSGTIFSPAITGTATYPVAAATSALSANNQFVLQTQTGSAILVVRSGGTNFFWSPSGTF